MLNFTGCDESTLGNGNISLIDNTYEIEYWQNTGVKEYQYQILLECPLNLNKTSVVFTTESGQQIPTLLSTFEAC
jgi:hypothetical protein